MSATSCWGNRNRELVMYVALCGMITSTCRVENLVEKCMAGLHRSNIETPGMKIGHAVYGQGASRLGCGVVVVDVVRKNRTFLE